ncbi:MAG: HD domain-containing protein [Acidimicrobiia bacterium]|nr:HD domain-containing protein [Acidimicrobiia bacterium]
MADHVQEAVARSDRWEGRPVQAALLRVIAVAVPVAAGVLASIVFSRIVGYPEHTFAVVAWWIAVLTISTVVVALVERQCRRLIPLATLLKLSMVFPDKAPSRFGVALRAGTVRNLEQRVAEVRAHGIDDEPARAAAQILELVGALGVHDKATRGHAERVRAYADLVGVELGLTEDDRDRLRWAALLHDVGKVAVPSEILNKTGKPDEGEWAVIHSHPEEGAKLAAPLRNWLGEWADTIEQHHERWDGLGYPHQLKGEQISRGARIVSVADSFEVMTAARSYKKAMDVAAAREELTAGAGTQFDPAMVRAFLNVSLGRLRWMVGPLAWVAELPFLRGMPWDAGGQVVGMAARVVAGASIFVAAAAPATASGAPDAHQASTPQTSTMYGQPTAAPSPSSADSSASPDPTTTSTSTSTTLPGAPDVIDTTTTTVLGEVPPPSDSPAPPATPSTAPPTTAKPTAHQPTPSTTTTSAPKPTGPTPIATDDAATTHHHDPVDINVTANDVPNVGTFVFPIRIVDALPGTNLSLKPDGHTVHYVPNTQTPGTYVFHYQVCDAGGGCATGAVTVTVEP